MIIETHFKIDHCCAPDDIRPILEYVNVTQFEGVDVAIAADGYMMAIVPVTLEKGDVPGLIHGDVMRYARKLSPRQVQMKLEADTVLFGNGWRAPRFLFDPKIATEMKFPDVGKIVDAARKSKPLSPHVALNPQLLHAVQKAIGAQYNGVILTRSEPTGPLLVSTLDSKGPFVPPFGILMPMMGSSWADKAPAEPVAASA
jgi:hypothetical protein